VYDSINATATNAHSIGINRIRALANNSDNNLRISNATAFSFLKMGVLEVDLLHMPIFVNDRIMSCKAKKLNTDNVIRSGGSVTTCKTVTNRDCSHPSGMSHRRKSSIIEIVNEKTIRMNALIAIFLSASRTLLCD